MGKRWSGYLPDNKGRVFHSIFENGPPTASDIDAITAIIDSLSDHWERKRDRRNTDAESPAAASPDDRGDALLELGGFDASD